VSEGAGDNRLHYPRTCPRMKPDRRFSCHVGVGKRGNTAAAGERRNNWEEGGRASVAYALPDDAECTLIVVEILVVIVKEVVVVILVIVVGVIGEVIIVVVFLLFVFIVIVVVVALRTRRVDRRDYLARPLV